jgi:hypothetical protein
MMIIRGATLLGRAAAFLVTLFALTACGGGGGGGGFLPEPVVGPTIAVALFAPNGESTDAVTAALPGTVRVQVTGQVVSNVVVSAAVNPVSLGTIDPPSSTALTDANGMATFRLLAGAERGAATVTVNATVDGLQLTESLGFQVGDTGLRLGYFDEDGTFIENQIFVEPSTTLAAGGNAQLSVVLLDENNQRITTSEVVTFNSGCITAGLATINPAPSSQTVNGRASTLYTAQGCEGNDDITASTGGSAAQAFATINVASPETNAIAFESAEPTLIVLRGTGGVGRDETSDVLFTVVDGNGNPLQGVTVNFGLTTDVGGIELSTDSALSNGDGQVRVTVQAGDVATVIRVIAQVDNGNGEIVSTLSDQLTITTGLPDQNSISLAVGDCEGEGTFVVDAAFNVDGLCRTLTVAMADKFNNPVVDGTAAVFTTEYGSIVGSCETVGGTCQVEWRSQSPRLPTLSDDDFVRTIFDDDYNCPSHNGSAGPCPDDLGYIRGGRSSILVHAIGEESFIDRNGNGIFDSDETDLFDNLPEAFLDHNEDGIYTPADPECAANPMGTPRCISGVEEIFIDFDGNDTYDDNDEPPVYNGLLCPPKGDGIWCSRELVHVRDWNVVTLGNAPNFFLGVEDNRTGNLIPPGGELDNPDPFASNDFYIGHIADNFNNPPPGGSTVDLSTEGNCEVPGVTSFEVPNYFAGGSGQGNGAFSFAFQTLRDITDEDTGIVIISLTTPTSNVQWAYSCDLTNCDENFSPRDPACPPLEEPPPTP